MNYSRSDVLAAQSHFEGNWGEVRRSQQAACSMCLAQFKASDVIAFYRFEDGIAYDQALVEANDSDTAKCPHCAMPYVIGDLILPIAAEGYLEEVRSHWHGQA